VERAKPRGRQKRIWREIVQKYCHARNLNREEADKGGLIVAWPYPASKLHLGAVG